MTSLLSTEDDLSPSPFDSFLNENVAATEERHTSLPSTMNEKANEYLQRLDTFTHSFSIQPLALSPIICSYFGWIQPSNPNIPTTATAATETLLQCVTCRSYLCLQFHPLLTPASSLQLVDMYLQMIATSHKVSCPFRSEAERWLWRQKETTQDSSSCSPSRTQSQTTREQPVHAVFFGENKDPPSGAYSGRDNGDRDSTASTWINVPLYLLSISDEYQFLYWIQQEQEQEKLYWEDTSKTNTINLVQYWQSRFHKKHDIFHFLYQQVLSFVSCTIPKRKQSSDPQYSNQGNRNSDDEEKESRIRIGNKNDLDLILPKQVLPFLSFWKEKLYDPTTKTIQGHDHREGEGEKKEGKQTVEIDDMKQSVVTEDMKQSLEEEVQVILVENQDDGVTTNDMPCTKSNSYYEIQDWFLEQVYHLFTSCSTHDKEKNEIGLIVQQDRQHKEPQQQQKLRLQEDQQLDRSHFSMAMILLTLFGWRLYNSSSACTTSSCSPSATATVTITNTSPSPTTTGISDDAQNRRTTKSTSKYQDTQYIRCPLCRVLLPLPTLLCSSPSKGSEENGQNNLCEDLLSQKDRQNLVSFWKQYQERDNNLSLAIPIFPSANDVNEIESEDDSDSADSMMVHSLIPMKRRNTIDHYMKRKGSTYKSSPPKKRKVCITNDYDENLDFRKDSTVTLEDALDESINSSTAQVIESTNRKFHWNMKFHLIENHRHYCPYSAGFMSDGLQTQPAWKSTLLFLLKYQAYLKSCSSTTTNAHEMLQQNNYWRQKRAENAVKSVQNILNSALSRQNVDD